MRRTLPPLRTASDGSIRHDVLLGHVRSPAARTTAAPLANRPETLASPPPVSGPISAGCDPLADAPARDRSNPPTDNIQKPTRAVPATAANATAVLAPDRLGVRTGAGWHHARRCRPGDVARQSHATRCRLAGPPAPVPNVLVLQPLVGQVQSLSGGQARPVISQARLKEKRCALPRTQLAGPGKLLAAVREQLAPQWQRVAASVPETWSSAGGASEATITSRRDRRAKSASSSASAARAASASPAAQRLLRFHNRPIGPASADAPLERRPCSRRHPARRPTDPERTDHGSPQANGRAHRTARRRGPPVLPYALSKIRRLDVMRIQRERIRDRTLSLVEVTGVERPLRASEVRNQLPEGGVGRGHRVVAFGRA